MRLIPLIALLSIVSASLVPAAEEVKSVSEIGVNTEIVAPSNGLAVVSAPPHTAPVPKTTTTTTAANLSNAVFAIFLVPIKVGIVFFALVGFAAIQRSANGNNPFQPRTSSASFEVVQQSPIRFEDVIGCDEIRHELMQILDIMKRPERYERFGAKTPKGVLLKGPPGTGKTLIAKALAGESNIPLISTSGSAFEEALVGVGAARVRDLFARAREFNQSIIFIDEIDGIAGKRTAESKNTLTLNQLLVEMDGFNPSQIFVLAATNAYKELDPAILRPGRFDMILTLNLPDAKGRAQIIKHNLKSVSDLIDDKVNITKLAAETIGFSGAELAQLVNQAKLIAASSEAETMKNAHFDQALRLTRFGPKRALLMSQQDRFRVALHEAGHALIGLLTPSAMPVQSATIIPHASSLGMVVSVPKVDTLFTSHEANSARIDVLLAGWLAEELAFNREQVSTGAMSDLQKANAVARHMVDAGFGLQTGFLQPLLAPQPHLSSELARQRYEEDVISILEASKARVRAKLQENEVAWRAVAEALLEHETLSGAQMHMIIDSSFGKKDL